MWVIDQAFPTNCGAWLFKIHTHDDNQILIVAVSFFFEQICIFECGFGVVNRAWTNHHQQAIIMSSENGICGIAGG